MIQRSLCLTSVLWLVAVCSAGAQAPEPAFPSPTLMAGFVANAPDQLLGAGAAWLPSFLRGWGLYVDYKKDIDSPADESNFIPDITAEEAMAMDELRVTTSSFTSVNFAVVREFRPDVIVYLGGGISEESVYSEFFDFTQEIGNFGHYWVEHETAGDRQGRVLGGIFFRLARHVGAQFGAETAPTGFTVGLHLAL